MSYFAESLKALLPELEAKFDKGTWLILLEGDLGVGKTTWTQEFIESLGGCKSDVKSPTFLKVLPHKIEGWGEVLHMDAYRVEDSDEFLRVGLESYETFRALVVEWPEIFVKFLREHPEFLTLLGMDLYLKLEFKMDAKSGARTLAPQWGRLRDLI